MPNLPSHIHLAQQAAELLDWGHVFDHIGSYYLGSTSPDIRAMTRWPRERTHFAPLSVEEVGTGARTMLQRYPELADHPGMPPPTRAFVLGYISHLVADEVWITTMFRPHFDNDNMITDSEVEAHIWDRALQLDMDRQTLVAMNEGINGETTGYHSASEAMVCADQGVEVEFLEAEVLQEWRDWVRRFIGWEFSWDRLKRALNRMYRDNDDVQQAVDRFLQGMPYSLERVYEKIPEEKMTAYRKQVLDETVVAAREYISGA